MNPSDVICIFKVLIVSDWNFNKLASITSGDNLRFNAIVDLLL